MAIFKLHLILYDSKRDGFQLPIVGIRNLLVRNTHLTELLTIEQAETNDDLMENGNYDDISMQPLAVNLNDSDNQQPDWSLNYLSAKNSCSAVSFSTSDLISWSFQIARGMNYLVGKKV